MPIANEYEENKKETVASVVSTPYPTKVFYFLVAPITLPLAQMPINIVIASGTEAGKTTGQIMDTFRKDNPQGIGIVLKAEWEIDKFIKSLNLPPQTQFTFVPLNETPKVVNYEHWAELLWEHRKELKKFKITKI